MKNGPSPWRSELNAIAQLRNENSRLEKSSRLFFDPFNLRKFAA
ncbi:hypothetical protein RISK_001549 [Rhodopirellula islandica]|uniref:Uncharacterized protein n=1 Tax=Rhodopirellula islandica TaxID=595434 RepID=A0A0J1BIP5_RHOIS|nr:hypothetical protein RISK_001549 [Rhodopirellula islandica]